MAMKVTPSVEVKVSPRSMQILINGIPHLIFRRSELIGIQTYYETQGMREKVYRIDFEMTTRTINAEYDNRELWIEISKQLGDAKLFDAMLGDGLRELQ